jgi:hypothetical protein
MSDLADAGFYKMSETEQLKFLENREANKPKPGELVMTTRHDQTGRAIHEFHGAKSAWMDQFKSRAWLQIRIDKHAKGPF